MAHRSAGTSVRLEVLRLDEEKWRDSMRRGSPVERARDAEAQVRKVGAELGAARALATVAEGRDRGAGQVLLQLIATSAAFDRCYVRLPDLDLLAPLRARLGLR